MRLWILALFAALVLAGCAPAAAPELRPITTEVAFSATPNGGYTVYSWESRVAPFAEVEVMISGSELAQSTPGCTGSGNRVTCILDGPFRAFELPLGGEVSLWTFTAVFVGSSDSYFMTSRP